MNDLIKDISIFIFGTSRKIEKKSKEISLLRKERYNSFRDEFSAIDNENTSLKNDISKTKNSIIDLIDTVHSVASSEFDQLKRKIKSIIET